MTNHDKENHVTAAQLFGDISGLPETYVDAMQINMNPNTVTVVLGVREQDAHHGRIKLKMSVNFAKEMSATFFRVMAEMAKAQNQNQP